VERREKGRKEREEAKKIVGQKRQTMEDAKRDWGGNKRDELILGGEEATTKNSTEKNQEGGWDNQQV